MKQHKPMLTGPEWDQVNSYIQTKDAANRKKAKRARAKKKPEKKKHFDLTVPGNVRVCGPWHLPSWNY